MSVNVTGTSGTFDAGTLVACNLSAYAAAGNVSAASGPTVFSYSTNQVLKPGHGGQKPTGHADIRRYGSLSVVAHVSVTVT